MKRRKVCFRCGRRLAEDEVAMIGDLYYCHPDDPSFPDCYGIVSATGERAFPKKWAQRGSGT